MSCISKSATAGQGCFTGISHFKEEKIRKDFHRQAFWFPSHPAKISLACLCFCLMLAKLFPAAVTPITLALRIKTLSCLGWTSHRNAFQKCYHYGELCKNPFHEELTELLCKKWLGIWTCQGPLTLYTVGALLVPGQLWGSIIFVSKICPNHQYWTSCIPEFVSSR